jgi:EF-P beta-lysylation protein EpmB
MIEILTASDSSVRAVGAPAARWQDVLRRAVRDPVELCRRVGLPEAYHLGARRAAKLFPVFAPEGYIARMRHGDPDDPLLRQVLPLSEECAAAPGFVRDPVDDESAATAPGVLRKYSGRVLLVTTGACAVHCRYCFRRHYPYETAPRGILAWQPALAQIAADRSIREVILSGGDPLNLVDEQLAALVQSLAQIPHLARLRIHTRLPVVIPERVCRAMLRWLTSTRLTPVVVIHANHAAELDASVAAAVRRIADAGAVLLNQSVLLRGVNDRLEALVDLSERLVDLRVIPYYLHQLDRVAGAAHFEVPLERGVQLIEQLRRKLPGYAVPRYVQERAGEPSKSVLA